jgi:hypothetical protein
MNANRGTPGSSWPRKPRRRKREAPPSRNGTAARPSAPTGEPPPAQAGASSTATPGATLDRNDETPRVRTAKARFQEQYGAFLRSVMRACLEEQDDDHTAAVRMHAAQRPFLDATDELVNAAVAQGTARLETELGSTDRLPGE